MGCGEQPVPLRQRSLRKFKQSSIVEPWETHTPSAATITDSPLSANSRFLSRPLPGCASEQAPMQAMLRAPHLLLRLVVVAHILVHVNQALLPKVGGHRGRLAGGAVGEVQRGVLCGVRNKGNTL